MGDGVRREYSGKVRRECREIVEGGDCIDLGLRGSVLEAFDEERDGARGRNAWFVDGGCREGEESSHGVFLKGLVGGLKENKKGVECTGIHDFDLVPAEIKPYESRTTTTTTMQVLTDHCH